jgi:hypothetical protein
MTLAEVLALVDLDPGRTYRCRVKGLDVEVRVSDEESSSEQVTKVHSLFQFMKPFKIEECDLAPGDLSDVEDDMKLLSDSDETDETDAPEIIRKAN